MKPIALMGEIPMIGYGYFPALYAIDIRTTKLRGCARHERGYQEMKNLLDLHDNEDAGMINPKIIDDPIAEVYGPPDDWYYLEDPIEAETVLEPPIQLPEDDADDGKKQK